MDKQVAVAVGTKLGPQQGATQMQAILGKLQATASNIFGGVGGSVIAGGMAGGLAGAMVGLAQGAASKFQEAFQESIKAAGQDRRFAAYFGNLTPLATQWAVGLSEATKYCERDVGALMGQVYNMAKGLGMTTKESADLSQQVSVMAANFAAFQGIGLEDAFGTIEAAIAGNTRGLRQYGIVFSETEKQAIEALKNTGDEAATAAKMIELLGQKMGAMADAATKEGLGKTIREYAAAKEDLMIALGRMEGWFAEKIVNSAKGWKMIAEEATGSLGAILVELGKVNTNWKMVADLATGKLKVNPMGASDEVKAGERKAAESRLKLQDQYEREARAAAAETARQRIDQEAGWFQTVDAELAKLKELNEAAKDGDAAAVKAAEDQARAVDKLMGYEGKAADVRARHAADELREKLRKGEAEGLVLDRAKDLLKLEEERAKKAKELAEARAKEAAKLSEQYGMLGALERGQARNVLERLRSGGYEAYKGMGEKEMKYAKEFGGEQVKGYARRLASEELGAGGVAGALTMNNEITAKIEVDGPSIARQITEKVWPAIAEILNGSAAALLGAIRGAQSGGQAVAGAASE